MSIFNHKGAEEMSLKENNYSSSTKDTHTIIGEGTHFKGNLSFDGAVRIDGEVEGEISSNGTLIIGEKSVTQAQIKINSIIVGGKLYGEIIAKGRVVILSSAEVCGNIKTPILIIEEGAKFEGTCNMGLETQETKYIPYKKTKNNKKEGVQETDTPLKEVA